MIKSIKILDHLGNFRRVWALVDGNLAITPYLTERGVRKHWFNITHIHTGCCVGRTGLGKKQARIELQRWHNKKWNGIPLEDIPACEIVTCYELIADSVGGHNSDHTKHLIEKSYRCNDAQTN